MADLDDIDEFDDEVAGLASSLSQASDLAAGFDGELQRIQQAFAATSGQARELDRSLSGGVRDAIDAVVKDGANMADALGIIRNSMIDGAYNAAVKPISDGLGGLLGGLAQTVLPFEKGGAFSQGRVVPFAKGGVVDSPVTFPMRGATGLMGEAGPEAIMPLTRGADGRLGVQAQGGGRAVNVVMNINTPDVGSFQRSQSQIAAQMSRVIERGRRNR